MTRQVFLTFYGNERFRPVDADEADGEAHAEIVESDTPTVAYGEPPRTPAMHHDPHEGNGLMVGPVVLLAGLAVVGGLLDLPFERLEFLNLWLEPVFEDIPHHIDTPSFVGGVALSILAFAMALVGLVVAWVLYHRGLESVERDPFDERLGPLGRLFGHAYYYDEGISRAVDGPLRGFAAWLARVFDAKVIDGAVNGVGWLVRETSLGFRKLQTGFVRNYALGIVLGTVALLRLPHDLGGPLMHEPSATSRSSLRSSSTPAIGALDRVPPPVGPGRSRSRAVGYAATAATLGLSLWMLWHFETGRAGYQFVESERWIGLDRRAATSSGSTASASS